MAIEYTPSDEIHVGDQVLVLRKDAKGKRQRRAGQIGIVVSTDAGVFPGLYTYVVFDKAHKADRRRWCAYGYGGLRRLRWWELLVHRFTRVIR